MSQRLVNNRSYYGNSANSLPAPGAGDRLADAHLFLHVPDAGSHRLDDRHFEVFLHLHGADDPPFESESGVPI